MGFQTALHYRPFLAIVVDQCRYLVIGADPEKLRPELIAAANIYFHHVTWKTILLQHDRNLHVVRRREIKKINHDDTGQARCPLDALMTATTAIPDRSGTFHTITDPRKMHRDFPHPRIGTPDRDLVQRQCHQLARNRHLAVVIGSDSHALAGAQAEWIIRIDALTVARFGIAGNIERGLGIELLTLALAHLPHPLLPGMHA